MKDEIKQMREEIDLVLGRIKLTRKAIIQQLILLSLWVILCGLLIGVGIKANRPVITVISGIVIGFNIMPLISRVLQIIEINKYEKVVKTLMKNLE